MTAVIALGVLAFALVRLLDETAPLAPSRDADTDITT